MNIARTRRRLLAAHRYQVRTGHRSLRTNDLDERYRNTMYLRSKAEGFRSVRSYMSPHDPYNCGGLQGPWPPCGGCYHCNMAMVEHYAWKRWLERRKPGQCTG